MERPVDESVFKDESREMLDIVTKPPLDAILSDPPKGSCLFCLTMLDWLREAWPEEHLAELPHFEPRQAKPIVRIHNPAGGRHAVLRDVQQDVHGHAGPVPQGAPGARGPGGHSAQGPRRAADRDAAEVHRAAGPAGIQGTVA